MTYGRVLDNGTCMLFPPQIKYQGVQYTNPDQAFLESLGYKPVIFTVPPEVQEGYHLVESWTNGTNYILQSWTTAADGSNESPTT